MLFPLQKANIECYVGFWLFVSVVRDVFVSDFAAVVSLLFSFSFLQLFFCFWLFNVVVLTTTFCVGLT